MTSGYHDSRLVYDAKRAVVWKALWRYYFCNRINTESAVLDMGCGYCEFINNVVARERIAMRQKIPNRIPNAALIIVGC